jgi:sugar O-acyltransferase (sialic acid O-acetyltransferase NeuD family)
MNNVSAMYRQKNPSDGFVAADLAPATSAASEPLRRDSLVLIGGGGHALVIAEAAALRGYHLPGYFDDHPLPALAQGRHPLTSLGRLQDLARVAGRPWILAVGNLALRRDLLSHLAELGDNANARPVIHPSAIVSPSAHIGTGVYVGPGAIIHSRAVIDDHAIINSGVIIEHECRIGSNTHIAPGTVLGGGVRVGHDTLVGLGVRILPTLSIGEECVVGAGAIVTRSVPDQHRAKGIPAIMQRRPAVAPVVNGRIDRDEVAGLDDFDTP